MTVAGPGDAPSTGTLWGIGVGPGDPELMTLKAARRIAACPVVAYPALPGVPSFARAIAAAAIPAGCTEIAIEVPMTAERGPAQAAYDIGAARIAEALSRGQDVACLCEGDPLFYGSFMYLHARLADRFAVAVIPGVTSISACTAAASRPLAARNERISVLPAPLPEAELSDRIAAADSAAILKVGRHLPKIRRVIDALGLLDRATFVARASLPDQVVCPLAEAPADAPYFSMVLIARGADPWL